MPLYASFDEMRSAKPTGDPRHLMTKDDVNGGGAAIRYRSYERASDAVGGSTSSVTGQLRHNNALADKRGWTRIGDTPYSDNDAPASRRSKHKIRKDYERLLQDLAHDPGDVLIFFELARGSRDMYVYAQLRDFCLDNGPFFWQVGKNLYDIRERNDRQTLNGLANKAEGASDDISEAVLNGLETQALLGRPHGQTPFGYRRVYHKATRKMTGQEIDDQVRPGGWSPASVVRGIFDDYLAGVPMSHMVDALQGAGVPTPRRFAALRSEDAKRIAESEHLVWHTTMVFNILQNPHYMGVRLHRSILANENAIWNRIVDPEVFFEAQRRLKKRSVKKVRPTQAQTLLTCLARCRCGEEVVFQDFSGGKTKNRKNVYRCRTGDASVPAVEADAFVRLAMVSLFSDERVIQRVTLDKGEDAERARGLAAKLRGELSAWKTWAKDPGRDDVSMDDYDEMAAQLLPRIRAAEAEATKDVPGFVADLAGPEAELRWDRKSLAQRREILRAAVSITIIPAGRGCRNAKLEDRIILTETF